MQMFPGDEGFEDITVNMSRADIENTFKEYRAWLPTLRSSDGKGLTPKEIQNSIVLRRITATLTGCVDYEFTFASGHHQTGFRYDLSRIDLAHPNARFGFEPKGTLPLTSLAVDTFPRGSYPYAD